jgi:hypothetical protein
MCTFHGLIKKIKFKEVLFGIRSSNGGSKNGKWISLYEIDVCGHAYCLYDAGRSI